ncbi:MAG TPA: hypothetical protein VHM24_08470 [Gemmatimonadaceae bacterium]|nr:hypothetical protein [Gemmatimonadaceae bacterium]
MSFYSVPNSFPSIDSSRSYPRVGADAEVRFGMDDRSDIGVRFPSYSGVVLNYKRRLDRAGITPGTAFAVMGGAGLVNMGEHAHFELTFIASAQERSLTPYGGLRAMQVVPLEKGAVHDSPTIGGFAGMRIGHSDFAISPEIGVFYDRSALKLREGNIIIVPSVSISRSGRGSLFGIR